MPDITKITGFYCSRCNVRLKLVKGKYSIYYRCPKYELKHREYGDTVCTNSISIQKAYKINEILQKKYDDGDLHIGISGKVEFIKYEVVSIATEEIKVKIKNLQKLRN